MSSSGGRRGFSELDYAEIAADFATVSLVDVDVVGLEVTIPVTARPVLLRFVGQYQNTAANAVGIFTLTDDANVAVHIGSVAIGVAVTNQPFVYERRLAAAAASGKTFKARMRVSAGTGRVFATAPAVSFLQAISL